MNHNGSIILSEEELDSFILILTEKTGIIPRASHRDGIKTYLEAQISELKCDVQDYKKKLISDPELFSDFVNESTVNETYFFREEKQFILLRDKIFSEWQMKTGKRSINIWSAACSYGEEAYSLSLLAQKCGLTPAVTASDINSEVLNHCANGVFLGTSLRPMDGTSFHDILLPFRRADGKFEFNSDIKNTITTRKLNLSEINSPQTSSILPKNQDIIFLRNVFIYFTQELRARILHTITDKCLSEGGYLFVSMSEIAQLDYTIIPPSLEKIVDGNVFYFHKKGGKANG